MLVQTLRESDLDFSLLDASGNETESLEQTKDVRIGGQVCGLLEASGYAEFTLRDILYFIKNKDLDHSVYLQQAILSSISAVSYTQRKDLLDYLTKQSSTSRNLKSLESGPVDVNAALGKSESQGNRLEEAIRHVSDDKMALVKGDLPVVKSVLARERVLSTRKSILAIKGSKDFLEIARMGKTFFVDGMIPSKNAPSKSKSGKPTSSSARSSSKHASSNNTSSSSRARHSSQNQQKPGGLPIIIVPASSTSAITMLNIKSFLVDQKYIPSPGDQSKPNSVVMTRTKASNKSVSLPGSAVGGKTGSPPMSFQIFDSVDKFTRDDWKRVVAVFTTGQEWQFKNWGGKPVDIFAKMMGFCLLFNDEPVRATIKNWNVKQMVIHRHRRHLDSQVVFDFWASLDDWIVRNRPFLCS
ncbi:MAG: hypothetical protein SGCHY_003323 [Lobulomycetales sp.]